MPPERTNYKRKNAEGSSSKKNKEGVKQPPPHQVKANAIPGRQKLKASIRQAKRLLAKEGLAANVRVDTVRRLKALEAELEQAEVALKERDFAVRYHKVKFFERQKVMRKLNQVKKALQPAKASEKKKLEAELLNHRIDLNYVLATKHYPKTKKYISLFPPEVRLASSTSSSSTPASKPESDKTTQDREEIRAWIKECMRKQELPTEPELHLDSDKSSINQTTLSSQKFQAHTSGVSSKDHQKTQKVADNIEKDDFFDSSEGGAD